jgi:predicted RecA/RadA family phage recombinase
MSEATTYKDADTIDVITPAAGYASGEVLQLADGRAAYICGLRGPSQGDPAALKTSGQVTLAKTSGVVILDGDPLFWDRSANTATPLKAAAGADFFIGVAVGDAASADAEVVCDLNVKPQYVIDALKDPTDTVIVLTAGTPALTLGPGYAKLAFSATAEAQKVDLLSKHSIPVSVPFIVEGRAAVYDIGDEASVDINIGIASGTHASDCDAITESCLLHLDGTALDILAESDDGTTEVAATDTTVDAVDDTYFDFRMDCRDLADVKLYVNGVRVLASTAFKLDAATGPLKLLAHIEKGANDTPGEIRISHLAIRAMDVVR